MTKKQVKELEYLRNVLNITTKAENVVLEHMYMRDRKDILVYNYGDIIEHNGWVRITSVTNKHSFDFSVLASELEKGIETELWEKID